MDGLTLSYISPTKRLQKHLYVRIIPPDRRRERRIHLPLLSRVKGLPSIGKIPLNFQVVHMCYRAHPCHLWFNTQEGRLLENKENEIYRVQSCQICSHMRLVRICIDMVTSEDTNIGITGLCPKIRINRRTYPQLDKGIYKYIPSKYINI